MPGTGSVWMPITSLTTYGNGLMKFWRRSRLLRAGRPSGSSGLCPELEAKDVAIAVIPLIGLRILALRQVAKMSSNSNCLWLRVFGLYLLDASLNALRTAFILV